MSRVLVIPDVHLKPWIFDKADKVDKSSYDDIVVLGDLVDDWGQGNNLELYRETLDRAAAFGTEHNESIWCYGNHDVSYPWGKLETGYSPYAERTVISKLEELMNTLPDSLQIAIIQRIDNVLFCHGGLTEDFVNCLNEELIYADID